MFNAGMTYNPGVYQFGTNPSTQTNMVDEQRGKIAQYTGGCSLPDGTGHYFRRVSLQLYGYFGHGKTSLVNLCLSVFHNKPYEDCGGVSWSDGTLIRERQEHRLTDYLYMIDNRGFVKLDKDEVTEASAQLRSLRLEDEGVKWDRSMEEKMDLLLSKYNTTPTNFLVPVIVYRGKDVLTTEQSNNMKTFISRAFEVTGIFPVVLLMESGENVDKIRNSFCFLGVNRIVSLQKFTIENPGRDDVTDAEVINFLHVCINQADRGIRKWQRLGIEKEFKSQARELIRMELELEREKVKEKTVKEINAKQEQNQLPALENIQN